MVPSFVFTIFLFTIIKPSISAFGPFFYPTGSRNDSTFLTMGAHNSTHFYINLITGEHWFGFAFPDDCTPNSGCTGPLTLQGACSTPYTAVSGCKMDQADAIIFGFYGGSLGLTALEWTLNDHSSGSLHAMQNTLGLTYVEQFGTDIFYSFYITRPFDPSIYGDRISHKITYPFAGSFCWLWAMGESWNFSPGSNHQYAGYQCIDFGGDTEPPTPSPTYKPTPRPTSDPTVKPSRMPSSAGETAQPTMDPTKEPSIEPTEISANPSVTPTLVPTPGPTVIKGEPTKAPTLKPTPLPTFKPTVSPTPEPTDAPLEPGQTKSPSASPTFGPTTYEPSPGPTHKPTSRPTFTEISDMDTDVATDNSWLEENLTWILLTGIIAAIICFCSACFCFWCMQKKRTEKRRERRQNLLEAERFKIEQGLNIDADNRSKRNRAIAQRMAAKHKRRPRTGSDSGSGFKYGYGDTSTEESDEFFLDDEYFHGGTGDKYRSQARNDHGDSIRDQQGQRMTLHDTDDEKSEIYVTSGGTQGEMEMDKRGRLNKNIGGRKKKYKPVGGRRGNKGRGRTKAGLERKSKFVSLDEDKGVSLSIEPRKKSKPMRRGIVSSSDSDSSH